MIRQQLLTILFLFLLISFSDIATADAPVCPSDTASTGEETGYTYLFGCNDNDNDIVTVEVTSPAHGTLSAVTDDGFGFYTIYSPATEFDGSDTFTYQAVDALGNRSPVATATVTIVPQTDGGFFPLNGTSACFQGFTGMGAMCSHTGRGFDAPVTGAFSPDGISLYVIGQTYSTLAALSRDATTGVLSQAQNSTGCFSFDGTAESGGLPGICTVYSTLSFPTDVIVSPDGKNVYVSNRDSDAIVIFDRNTSSGALTNQRCISRDGNDGSGNPTCIVGGDPLANVSDLAISPDGNFLYTASGGDGFLSLDSSIAVFARDLTTGSLTTSSCVSQTGTPACTTTGIHDFASILSVVISVDGAHLYALSYGGIITIFNRDSSTGALSQIAGTNGCVGPASSPGCTTIRGSDTSNAFAITGDGLNIYGVTDLSSQMFTLVRNPATGHLTQPSDTAGCINDGGASGCSDNTSSGVPFGGFLSITSDPLLNLVASVSDDSGSNRFGHLFRRGTNGALTREPLPYGCFGLGACVPNTLSSTIRKVLFSPDGAFGYTLPLSGEAIFAYGRNQLPTCNDTSASVVHGRTVSVPLVCADANGDTVIRSITASPAHGTIDATNIASGSVSYTASASYTGGDTFTFRGTDGTPGGSGTATITVTNSAPICANVSTNITDPTGAQITFSCTDPDGDALTYSLVTPPGSGTLGTIDQANGTVAFTPSATGTITFTYTASDGVTTATPATGTFQVSQAAPQITLRQKEGKSRCGTKSKPCKTSSRVTSWEGTLLPSTYNAARSVRIDYYYRTGARWTKAASKTVTVSADGTFETRLRKVRNKSGVWFARATASRTTLIKGARSSRRYFRQ